jgi:hypothetical protein
MPVDVQSLEKLSKDVNARSEMWRAYRKESKRKGRGEYPLQLLAAALFEGIGYNVNFTDLVRKGKLKIWNRPDMILNGKIAVEVKILTGIHALQIGIGQCVYSLACGFEEAFLVVDQQWLLEDVLALKLIVPKIRYFVIRDEQLVEING